MIMFNRHVMFGAVEPEQAMQHVREFSGVRLHARRGAVACYLIVEGQPMDGLKLLMLMYCAAARRLATGLVSMRLPAIVVAVCSGHSDEYYD